MDALLRRLGRTGLRRGLTGEHWAWLVLAGAAYLLRRGRERPAASTTVDLTPGERYLIRVVPASVGRGRKARTARELADLDLTDLLTRLVPDAGNGRFRSAGGGAGTGTGSQVRLDGDGDGGIAASGTDAGV